MSNFDNIKINDVLNFLVSNMSTENPLDYFDKIYEENKLKNHQNNGD